MMTVSFLAGPNFSVISCLCLWTAKWSSFVNLCAGQQIKQGMKRNLNMTSGAIYYLQVKEGRQQLLLFIYKCRLKCVGVQTSSTQRFQESLRKMTPLKVREYDVRKSIYKIKNSKRTRVFTPAVYFY